MELAFYGAWAVIEIGIAIAKVSNSTSNNNHENNAHPGVESRRPPKVCYTQKPPPTTSSSLSSRVSIRCQNCTLYYTELENFDRACKHHHGRYNLSGVLPQWTCCKKTEKENSQCCVGWHYPSMSNQEQSTNFEGYMTKQGHIFKTWKTRYFRLSGHMLTYYEDQPDTPLGSIDLRGATVSVQVGTDNNYEQRQMLRLHDTVNNKTFLMYAEDSQIYRWKEAIEEAINQLNPYRVPKSPEPPSAFIPPSLSSAMPDVPPPAYEDVVKPSSSSPPPYPHLAPPPYEEPSEEDSKNYLLHTVLPTDTLAGVALKYNTTTQAIKKANKMTTNEVITRKVLYIPKDENTPVVVQEEVSEEYKRKMATAKFVRTVRVQWKEEVVEEEALFYLDSCNWDVDAALAQWKEDSSFGRR